VALHWPTVTCFSSREQANCDQLRKPAVISTLFANWTRVGNHPNPPLSNRRAGIAIT
jgi:hypothetical protein